ncbi:isoamyl acetate-hydrolyzing esterase [Coemansia sp. RSA 988]|nr:isoamyl acetate-hydrolyzing esterase [Coemansia sp. RSA 988]
MPPTLNKDYDKLICIGDSLTQHGWDVTKQGWVAQLARTYLRRLDIINRGFSGFNSRWAKIVIPRTIPTPVEGSVRPRLVTIFYGSNDAQYAGMKCHVPLDEFKANIIDIVNVFRSPGSELYSPGTRVILITQPPVGDRLYAHSSVLQGKPVDRRKETSEPYAEAVREAARELRVPCVDLWTAMEAKIKARQNQGTPSEFEGYEDYLWDGLHLNDNGNNLLFKLLMETITANFPELIPDSMPFIIPPFHDFADPEELIRMLDSR